MSWRTNSDHISPPTNIQTRILVLVSATKPKRGESSSFRPYKPANQYSNSNIGWRAYILEAKRYFHHSGL
ncbi:hypothetical protein FC85_GL000183 [Lentilactobacillus diolivorans DSM 14421]|uniref:Uncharacterized protein n=1 Tax=Lentilactobacillus diolivorans DSM 14421 TaxID=1423739 RepID=A0A0R1SAB9_9LACO|nr:hypothetical protein FC85_GL000183 [Lentilactobacillus diolivorans DSM 14421]